MTNGIRWGMLCVVAALVLGASAASGAAGQTLIVTSPECCAGGAFTVQTLDGTVVDSVPAPAGADPVSYAAAADDSIVYDDASQGTGADDGPVWLVGPNESPVKLDSSPSDFDASISHDGSRVAFARYDAATGSSDIYVVNADGSGLTLVAQGGGDDNLSHPEFSPDGASIAYFCEPANDGPGVGLGCGPTVEGTYFGSGLMLMNADGSDKRLIVVGSSGLGDRFSWSPDGLKVAVIGCVTKVVNNVHSCGPNQVFAYRTDGSDLFNSEEATRQVTHETVNAGRVNPQFSPDGAQILFMSVVDNGWVLFSVDSDGTNEHQVSSSTTGKFEVVPPATGGAPPATQRIATGSGPGVGSIVLHSWLGQCHGYITVTASGAFKSCVAVPAGAEGAIYAPAANGSVVFSDVKHGQVADGGPIWLAAPGKTGVELDSSPYDLDPAISRDGSKVAFARFDPKTGAASLYVVNSDGSGLRLVAAGGANDDLEFPTFAPDGRSIAYACGPALAPNTVVPSPSQCGPLFDGTYRASGVMLMNSDGSHKRMILDGVGGEPMSWSPDGQWLAVGHCVTKVVHNVYSCGPNQVFAYRTDGSDLFNLDDPSRQVTHETTIEAGASIPQFSQDGSELLFLKTVDDSGEQGNFSYVVNRDGTDEHEIDMTLDAPTCPVMLCDTIVPWGQLVPAATGRGPSATVKPTQATVPNVHALKFRKAKNRLAAVHLKAKVTRRIYSSQIRRGRVISQYPHARAHARLKKKRKPVVRLVLSRGLRHQARR